MSADMWLLALLCSAYVPYPYSWKDGSDRAWHVVWNAIGRPHPYHGHL